VQFVIGYSCVRIAESPRLSVHQSLLSVPFDDGNLFSRYGTDWLIPFLMAGSLKVRSQWLIFQLPVPEVLG
jgi:hypothetical protein